MPQAFEPMLQRLQQMGMPQVSQQVSLLGSGMRSSTACLSLLVLYQDTSYSLWLRLSSHRPAGGPVHSQRVPSWCGPLSSHRHTFCLHRCGRQPMLCHVSMSAVRSPLPAEPQGGLIDSFFGPALVQRCHVDCRCPSTLLSSHVQAPSPLSPWLATQSWSSGRRLPAGPFWCQHAPCW